MRHVSNGTAVALVNKYDCASYPSRNITATFAEIGLDSKTTYSARDLWAQKDIDPISGPSFKMEVPCHGVQFLLLNPKQTKGFETTAMRASIINDDSATEHAFRFGIHNAVNWIFA